MYANAAVSGEAHRSRWQYLRATWLIGCCIVCALLRREDSQFLSLHMIFVVTHDETITNRNCAPSACLSFPFPFLSKFNRRRPPPASLSPSLFYQNLTEGENRRRERYAFISIKHVINSNPSDPAFCCSIDSTTVRPHRLRLGWHFDANRQLPYGLQVFWRISFSSLFSVISC